MAAGYTDDKVTPTKRPKVSNAPALELPEDDQPPKSLVPHDQSSENVDARESRENIDLDKPSDTMSSKGKSCSFLNLKCESLSRRSIYSEHLTKT